MTQGAQPASPPEVQPAQARRFSVDLWPKIETIKAIATYGIAGYVVWATLDTLRYMVSLDPGVFGVAAIGIISILATGVVTFLFGVEQGKQQQVNTQRAFEAGAQGAGAATTTPGPSSPPGAPPAAPAP